MSDGGFIWAANRQWLIMIEQARKGEPAGRPSTSECLLTVQDSPLNPNAAGTSFILWTPLLVD